MKKLIQNWRRLLNEAEGEEVPSFNSGLQRPRGMPQTNYTLNYPCQTAAGQPGHWDFATKKCLGKREMPSPNDGSRPPGDYDEEEYAEMSGVDKTQLQIFMNEYIINKFDPKAMRNLVHLLIEKYSSDTQIKEIISKMKSLPLTKYLYHRVEYGDVRGEWRTGPYRKAKDRPSFGYGSVFARSWAEDPVAGDIEAGMQKGTRLGGYALNLPGEKNVQRGDKGAQHTVGRARGYPDLSYFMKRHWASKVPVNSFDYKAVRNYIHFMKLFQAISMAATYFHEVAHILDAEIGKSYRTRDAKSRKIWFGKNYETEVFATEKELKFLDELEKGLKKDLLLDDLPGNLKIANWIVSPEEMQKVYRSAFPSAVPRIARKDLIRNVSRAIERWIAKERRSTKRYQASSRKESSKQQEEVKGRWELFYKEASRFKEGLYNLKFKDLISLYASLDFLLRSLKRVEKKSFVYRELQKKVLALKDISKAQLNVGATELPGQCLNMSLGSDEDVDGCAFKGLNQDLLNATNDVLEWLEVGGFYDPKSSSKTTSPPLNEDVCKKQIIKIKFR